MHKAVQENPKVTFSFPATLLPCGRSSTPSTSSISPYTPYSARTLHNPPSHHQPIPATQENPTFRLFLLQSSYNTYSPPPPLHLTVLLTTPVSSNFFLYPPTFHPYRLLPTTPVSWFLIFFLLAHPRPYIPQPQHTPSNCTPAILGSPPLPARQQAWEPHNRPYASNFGYPPLLVRKLS